MSRSSSAKLFLSASRTHRHNQSALGADGHTDIVEVVLDEIVVLNATIDDRHGFERFDACLNEERHQTEFHAVLFRELLLRFSGAIPARRSCRTR